MRATASPVVQRRAAGDQLGEVGHVSEESPPSELFVSIPAVALEAVIAAVANAVLERLELQLASESSQEWMSVETAARYLDVSPERLRKLQARPIILWVVDGLPENAASDKKKPRTLFAAPRPGVYSEFGS